jgi:thioesterase domain-containing protein
MSITEMAQKYVKVVQQRQPQGPYWLCGWSFGGLVAWEMARQWQDAGHTIALLAMFDTWPHAAAPENPVEAEAEMFSAMLAELTTSAGIALPPAPESPSVASPEMQLERLIGHIETSDEQAAAFLRRQGQRLLDEMRRNVLAGQRYLPPPLAGRIDLFVATGDGATSADRTRTAREAWGAALSPSALHVHPVTGSHLSIMLAEPDVARLAEQLADQIRIINQAMSKKAPAMQTEVVG